MLVVEEKRAVIENQLKEQLYNWPADRAAARHRQVRRDRRLDLAVERRADAGPDRPRHRPAARRASTPRPWLAERLALLDAQRAAARRRQCRAVRPHAVFLLGLPAQHLDPGAGRQPRAGRHRLPLHVAIDGPQHRDLHPDGRRGRALDRPGAVHRDASTSSPISATAPTSIPASWRSAPRSPPGSTSPTRSCSTTPSR